MAGLAEIGFAFYDVFLMKSANIFTPDSSPLTIGVLVLHAANTLSLAAVLDPLRTANRRAGKELFRWVLLTPLGAPVILTSGLQVPGIALEQAPAMNALFVVAGFELENQCTPVLLSHIRRVSGRVANICGVDGGPWILARAGILNQHRATTHWEDLEKFTQAFPGIDVTRDRFVIDGRVMTTGGAGPALDLMLHLIQTRHGVALAMRAAGALIYDPDPSGARPQSVTSTSRLMARAPKVAQAIQLMETHLEDPLPISVIAQRLGLTQRNLEHRFKAAINTSPGAYFLDLRLSEARRLALDTALPASEIALVTGFTSPASFARAFKKAHGLSVSDARRHEAAAF